MKCQKCDRKMFNIPCTLKKKKKLKQWIYMFYMQGVSINISELFVKNQLYKYTPTLLRVDFTILHIKCRHRKICFVYFKALKITYEVERNLYLGTI